MVDLEGDKEVEQLLPEEEEDLPEELEDQGI